jgi:serine/threonine protein kinase
MHITLRETSGPHPHLISLLFTYKEGGKFHLVFPWADVNLRDYWMRFAIEQIDSQKILWSLRQMTGLAGALSLIHGFQLPDEAHPGRHFGRHGDLKAENIVWFPSYPGCTDPNGILQITDLGLASLHNIGSVSNGDPAGVLGTKTYSPPDNHRNMRISRKWDIWSLGCLYLEFVTWIVLGFEAIVEFADLRSAEGGETEDINGIYGDYFYTADLRDVRPSVKAWATRLSEDERCSDMLYDLLCLIMLKMIRIEPHDRIDSQQLHQELLKILERASSKETYLVSASERPPIWPRDQKSIVFCRETTTPRSADTW